MPENPSPPSLPEPVEGQPSPPENPSPPEPVEGQLPDKTSPPEPVEGPDLDDTPYFPESEANEEEPTPATPRTTASVLRTAGRVSGRVVIGAVAVAVIAAVVAAAALVPLPSIRSAAPRTTIDPVPAAQQVVCPGGLLRLSNSQGKGASRASSLGAATVASGATSGNVQKTALKSSDAGTGGTAEAPLILSTPPGASGADRSLLGGAQSSSVVSSEFFGLDAAACTAATGDAWLVGGSTATGRTTLVMLANPSAVPATVSLQIFGEDGPVTAPGTTGIVVAAGGQRVISLAGFAPNLASPVVHVHSRGGQVVANLQQSTTRGLEPGGIGTVGPQAAAARRVVIPGVQLAGTTTVQSRLGEDGFSDLETVIRAYVPGTARVTARVTVTPESAAGAGAGSGKAASGKGSAYTAQLDPGTVTDLPVDLEADGSYTVEIEATHPIVAGVRASTAGSAVVAKKTDFVWMGAAPLLRTRAVVPVASGVNPILHLQNPGSAAVTVTLRAIGGAAADLSVPVPAGGSVFAPVAAGVVYQLAAPTPVYAAVSATSDGGVAGYVIYPAEAGATPLTVFG